MFVLFEYRLCRYKSVYVFTDQVQYKKRGMRGTTYTKLAKDRTPKEVLDTIAAARSDAMVIGNFFLIKHIEILKDLHNILRNYYE